MDAEVKKLEDVIKEALLIEKHRMVRQGAYDHTDKFEHYHREMVSLLPWLGPHIAKCRDQGTTLQVVKCVILTTTIDGGDSPRTTVEDRMEPRMGSVTT